MIGTVVRVTNGVVQHIHGEPWYEAPLPGRWHHCRAASIAVLNIGDILTFIERCRCGARRHTDLTHFTERQQHAVLSLVERENFIWTWGAEVIFREGFDYQVVNRWRERNTRRKGEATFTTMG